MSLNFDNQQIALVALSTATIFYFMTKSSGKTQIKHHPQEDATLPRNATHNIQRKASIARAGAFDHSGRVVILSDPAFDMKYTIFANVSSPFSRLVLSAKLSKVLYWRDEFITTISSEFDRFPMLPSIPDWDNQILNFMETECNFKCEHADGSFMDHLYFCRDYGAANYSQYSPRVLFLHSILGVGTNIFPMELSKLNQLRPMLTDFEFAHIEAFPSFLRLIYLEEFLGELISNQHRLQDLVSVDIHRVIDNTVLSLTAENLWIALNYQLIHQLDFLPASCWKEQLNDPLFQVFVRLYNFLTQTRKLEAKINFSLSSPTETDESGLPLTLGTLIARVLPSSLTLSLARQTLKSNSKEIGHDLSYTLHWK